MSPNFHCNDNENQNDFSVGTVSNTSKTHDSITILTLCILILRHPGFQSCRQDYFRINICLKI